MQFYYSKIKILKVYAFIGIAGASFYFRYSDKGWHYYILALGIFGLVQMIRMFLAKDPLFTIDEKGITKEAYYNAPRKLDQKNG